MPRLFTRLILFVIALPIIGIVFSANELRYIVWGKSADARLIDATAVAGRRRRDPPKIRVNYEFADGEKTRRESDDVPTDFGAGKTSTVPIEYIPDSTSSRLKGNDHRMWLWATGGVLIVGIGIGGLCLLPRRAK